MDFLCDEMLKGLGRWLRAAGYDTKIIEKRMEDLAILEIALQEQRLLLTRDRALAKMRRAKEIVLLLESNQLKACVQELNQRLPMNWLLNPFTRCLLCNTPLQVPTEEQRFERAPQDIVELWYCPTCDKIFWQASHTSRMYLMLQRFQQLQ